MATASTRAGQSYSLAPRPPGRLRRWAWRLTKVTVLLTAIAAVAWGGYGWRAERKLNATIAGYRTAGEPIDRGQFELPAVPDELNAAAALTDAAAGIDSESPKVKRVWDLEHPVGFPLTPDELAAYADAVNENQAALAGARRAVAMPAVDWKVRYDQPLVVGTLLPFLGKQRELSNVLNWAAIAAHQSGDDAAAVRHLREILFVSRTVDRQPGIIVHLVATGISALASETAAKIAPDLRVGDAAGAGKGVTPAARGDVEALVRELLDERAIDAAARSAMLAERMTMIDAAQGLADGRTSVDGVFTDGGLFAGPPASATGNAKATLYRYALKPIFYTDGQLLAEMATDSAAALSAPDYPSYQATPAATRARRTRDEVKRTAVPLHFLAAILSPSFERVAEQGYMSKAGRRMAATAVACRLYAVDNGGKLPPALGYLVPAHLPAVPRDPMTPGLPLGYRGTGDDPVVYSVGRNGRDDGGIEPDPTQTRREYEAVKDEIQHLKRQPRPPAKPPEEGSGAAPQPAAPPPPPGE